ncbi:MAG: acyl carrier protein [Chitinophagaceae bacterium]
MPAEVFNRIKDLIVTKKGVEAEKINIDSSFEELGMDSLDAVELVADMEEIFNVNIPNTDLQNFKTIRQAVEGLQKAISQ